MGLASDRLYAERSNAQEAHDRRADEVQRARGLLPLIENELRQVTVRQRELLEKQSTLQSTISAGERDLPRLAAERDRTLRAYNEARERERHAGEMPNVFGRDFRPIRR